MKDYKRLTNPNLEEYYPKYEFCLGCEHFENHACNRWNGNCANYEDFNRVYDRLFDLEDKIERGEIVDRNVYLDYLMAAKNTSELTDKEIEFFVKHNASVREDTNAEISRLTAENARLTAENDRLKDQWNNQRCVYSFDGEVMEYCVNGPCEAEKTIEDVRKETARLILRMIKDKGLFRYGGYLLHDSDFDTVATIYNVNKEERIND